MNIVVLVKGAVDEAELRADSSGHPVMKGAPMKVSNFDRVGVEEAVRQKEKHGGSVSVLSLGNADAKKPVREALAMGADKATIVLAEESPDALGTAYCLAKCVLRLGSIDLIFCSEGSSDTYQGQVGAMLAELLDLPFVADAKKVEVDVAKVKFEQRFEAGLRIGEAKTPAVISFVSEANRPRYPTLLQVMAASKKPIEEIPLLSLKDSDYPETELKVIDMKLQSVDRKKVIIEGAPEEAAKKLVEALKKEGVL